MHQAQAAQRLNQSEFGRIEVVELVVAVNQLGQLGLSLVAFPRQHHPQILHRRPHAAVIQVDHIQAVVAPQQVADVQVAVQADLLGRVGLQPFIDNLQQIFGNGKIGRLQAAGNHLCTAQEVHTVAPETLPIQRRAMLERMHGTDRVQAADQAAEHQQVVRVVQFGRMAAKATEQTETKAGMLEQRLAVNLLRRDYRNIPLGQLQTESVLLDDGGVAPATRAIEFGDQRLSVFDANLEYPVFIAIQRQDAGVGQIAKRLDRVQHGVGGEGGKRVAGHGGGSILAFEPTRVAGAGPPAQYRSGCARNTPDLH